MAHWLVTWEGTSERIIPPKRVVGVFDARSSPESIRRIVQALYATHAHSECEIVEFYRKGPHRAEFERIEGVRWTDHITCGHNPYLVARIVEKLKCDARGKVTWEERPPFKPLKPPKV